MHGCIQKLQCFFSQSQNLPYSTVHSKQQAFGFGSVSFFKTQTVFNHVSTTYLLDILWGQPIKLIQAVSTSEFHEY